MINRIIVLFATLFFCLSSSAQTINFNNGTWAEMLVKAKTERKLIFVDIYAVWCGPCKTMAKNVFTQKNVADKFNGSFVNYMLDAEKGEGVAIVEKYEVTSLPTYLFVDDTGHVVYKIEGALTADKFSAEADKALKKYQAGK